MKANSSGRVLFLQGASSAGKSTLAAALQAALPEYWWMLEADDITRMQPTSGRSGWWEPSPEERPHPSWSADLRLERWLSGYFGCLATIAQTGSNVIAVGGWLQTSWLVQLANTLNSGQPSGALSLAWPMEDRRGCGARNAGAVDGRHPAAEFIQPTEQRKQLRLDDQRAALAPVLFPSRC